MDVREATEADLERVSTITVESYVGDGLVRPDSPYVDTLADAASRHANGGLLVAVDGAGVVVGAVTYAEHGTPYAEVSGPGEAEFRMLAVAGAARQGGVGETLVRACLERARAGGCACLRLSTQPDMLAARRLYDRLGFRRTPERDWSPLPGVELLTYEIAP